MKKVMILLIVSLCWTGVAFAWDYNAEWSVDNGNPNGVWSYGNVELATGDFYPYEVGYGTAPTGVVQETTDKKGRKRLTVPDWSLTAGAGFIVQLAPDCRTVAKAIRFP